MGRAVIVTAIPVEFESVLTNPSLSNWKTDDQPGGIYRRGKFSGTSWEVLLVRSDKGDVAANGATERALQYFKPDVAFFVGVAGGIKDARLGDVVVADEVLYYEFAKVGKGKKIQSRPSGFRCGFDLVQIAHDEAVTKDWLGRLGKFDPENAPKALVGTIVAGEKLVASRRSAHYLFLKDNFNQAIAVEMEGYGFLHACYAHKVPGLVVRGISDLLSGKKKADAGGSQEMAARNALAFSLQVLDRLGERAGYLGKVINAPALPTTFLPREPDFQKVKNALLSEEKKTIGITSRKVGLQGMGGIGKTVLAAALAYDKDVRERFYDGIFWLTLGQKPDLVIRQLELAADLGERKNRAIIDVQDGRAYLSGLLDDKNCLIILDDVWDAQHINAFNVLGSGCRMMVTTRKAELLRGEFEYNLDVLNNEDALVLLARQAGLNRDELPIEAKAIIKECGNLPLALAMAGAMVQGRPDRWGAVLHRLRTADISKIKAEFPGYPYLNLFRALDVSVEDLEPHDKNRYLDLAVFPEDAQVPLAALNTFWESEGLDRFDVEDLTISFTDRSLARQGRIGLTLHDLQHDYLRKRSEDLKAIHNRLLNAYEKKCPNKWPSGPNDGYFFQHLAYHLSQAGRNEELKKLLHDFNWIRAKLVATDVTSLISDYDYLPTQDELCLIQGSLRLSSHILCQDPCQLSSQLIGRLGGINMPGILELLNQVRSQQAAARLFPLAPTLTMPGGPLRRTLEGHYREVYAVAVTPDGTMAISGSSDNTLKVWDLESGIELKTLKGHIDIIRVVAITPDKTRAISVSNDNTLKVWDLKNGKVLKTLKGHIDIPWVVAITPDGKRALSGSYDNTLKVWNLENGKVLKVLKGHTSPISAVAITPDGTKAVSSSNYMTDMTIRAWDLENGKELRTLYGHTDWVCDVAITPDGTMVISGSDDNTLKVWDLKNGKVLKTLKGHAGPVCDVAITPDGTMAVSGSRDNTLKVWDLKGGKVLKTVNSHTRRISAIATTRDGTIAVSGSEDNTLKVWDLKNGKVLRTLKGHADSVSDLAVTLDGTRAVSGSRDNTLKVWDLES